ncbi:hypothetical protein GGR51DRAFT_565933 [Nemania sp. FL0031]|nr:hypothetical protein GGR51DRAFT_565933 [Nemania sp. FL0031]
MSDTDSSDDFELSTGPLVLDIANTHDDNYTLSGRGDVQNFYKKLAENSQSTEDVIEWLGSIPYKMRNTAIPLFQECMTGTDDEVHYQVHPCHSQLPRIESHVLQPHFYVRKMKLSHNGPDPLVISFGRLFVNMPLHKPDQPDKTRRLSKWTGYELLFDMKLNLWIIFNKEALDNSLSGWFPVRCNLGHKPQKRGEGLRDRPVARSDLCAAVDALDRETPAASLEEMVGTPNFEVARIELPKPAALQDLSFLEIQEQIRSKMTLDGSFIYLVEADEWEVSEDLGQ